VDTNWRQLPTEEETKIAAYPSAEIAIESMKMGAVDYLIKPVAPDNLERLIRETLLKGKGRH
jgi:DNA-binding NtrC family response regulator